MILICCVLLLLPFSVYEFLFSKSEGMEYIRREYTLQEIVDDGATVERFDIVNDKTLKATDEDPWIYCPQNICNNMFNVTVDVENATNEGQEWRIFVFVDGEWEEEKIRGISQELKRGINIINYDTNWENNYTMRFDFTDKVGDEITINKIVFNNKMPFFIQVKEFWKKVLCICFILFAVNLSIYLWDNRNRKTKKVC